MGNSFSLIVAKAFSNLGFESLNPMQSEMLKISKKAKQILLFSPTGSGKTVAFLLPVLEIAKVPNPGIKALIVVPSRELALQIEQVFKSMGTGLKVSTCYGGHKVKTERNNLLEAPALLIGTPGRILYHLEKGTVQPNTIELLILDEYDKSFEFGFEREISAILAYISNPKQVILTSATKSATIPDFIKIQNPHILDYSSNEKPAGLHIKLVRAEEKDKLALLMKLLAGINSGLTLVFCNHREAVERISGLLQVNDIRHDTYHGGHEQPQRERALIKFRNGSNPILVTTDLASRGLDISGVQNIIHYQTASSETVFIHRNGRTARMENEGTVWILLSAEEKIPDYVPDYCEESTVPEALKPNRDPYFSTLYFGAGKKDKISKGDIVGLLIQKGGLLKDEIGLINILDYESFAAVPVSKIKKLALLLANGKIKNKKVKIALST
ncbi:MAG: DEAD/DEAH box helicase [Prolixibacteraceae bacterium]|jgi:ATP-independent RNA helicase DbpA|nr:DEAD/DEAH box helicase [Prolixibacteraceae bacterium]